MEYIYNMSHAYNGMISELNKHNYLISNKVLV
jgi:hypothetical protein